jgi:hypothetical protein
MRPGACAAFLLSWTVPAFASREVDTLRVMAMIFGWLIGVLVKVFSIWIVIAIIVGGVLLLVVRAKSHPTKGHSNDLSAVSLPAVVSLHELARSQPSESNPTEAPRNREQLLDAAARARRCSTEIRR